MSSNGKGSDNSTTEVVDLNAHANLTTISEFNKKFVPDKRMSDLGFLNWKYKSTKPNGENITSHYGILNTSNELVSQISVQQMRIWMDDHWRTCFYWGDWYNDPAYRGYGLRVLRHIIKRNPSLLAVSGSEKAYSIYERMKFKLNPIDQRFILLVDPTRMIFQSLPNYRKMAKLSLLALKTLGRRPPRSLATNGYHFRIGDQIDPQLLLNWEEDMPYGAVFVRREEWFFDWVVNGFPFNEFTLVTLNNEKRQVGYVLLHQRKYPSGLIDGKIVDIFALEWNWDNLNNLFRKAVSVLIDQGVHSISYHATHHSFQELARLNGFCLSGIQRVITYGAVSEVVVGDMAMPLHMTFYDHDEAYY